MLNSGKVHESGSMERGNNWEKSLCEFKGELLKSKESDTKRTREEGCGKTRAHRGAEDGRIEISVVLQWSASLEEKNWKRNL